MRRLRIVFLIDKVVDSGGAERIALALATHLPPSRFEIWMVSTRLATPEAVKTLTDAGVVHVHLGRRRKWDVHKMVGLARLLRKERIDIIHAHMFGSNAWAALLGRACGVPVIVAHEHTWSYEGERLRKWVDGQVIGRLASKFIAVSTLDAERMVALEGVAADKIIMIPNAYVPRPARAGGDVRAELAIPASAPVIGVVSLLRRQKALHVLLESVVRVRADLPETRVIVAGDGECRAELEQRARELGLTEHVHFLGYRTDIDDILAAADVAALSSDYEGTPLVAFECFMHETPLVATAVGGLPDIIENGRTGVLVPPRDPDALARALVDLLRDPARRERIAAAAVQQLPAFDIDHFATRFADIYEDLARGYGVNFSAALAFQDS